MEYAEIEHFLARNSKYFKRKQIPIIKKKLTTANQMEDEKYKDLLFNSQIKTFFYALFLSFFGVDCFYNAKHCYGVIKLITTILYFFLLSGYAYCSILDGKNSPLYKVLFVFVIIGLFLILIMWLLSIVMSFSFTKSRNYEIFDKMLVI